MMTMILTMICVVLVQVHQGEHPTSPCKLGLPHFEPRTTATTHPSKSFCPFAPADLQIGRAGKVGAT